MMSQTMQAQMDRPSVAFLFTGHICIDLCQGAIPALLPFLLLQRHLSYAAAAGLILAMNMASSVIQPLFGHVADRFAAPWLMPVGIIVAGAGLALAGLAPNYWFIALSVAICGIGVAAFHPEAARLMNAVAGFKKATGMSIFSIGGSLGFTLGPLVTTALLIALSFGGVSLLVIPLLIVAIMLFATQKRFAAYHSTGQQKARAAEVQQADAWGPFAHLTAMIIGRSIVFYGLNTFLPLYWIVVLHQTKAAGGVALTTLLASGILGTFVGGRMADRLGRRFVVTLHLAILAPLLLAFLSFSTVNPILALCLLVPVGFALFAPFSVMVVMGQEYLPNHVGSASGVTLGLAVTVGGIVAPLLGSIADHYGLHAAFIGLVAVPLLSAALGMTLPRSQRALTAPEQERHATKKEGDSAKLANSSALENP